VGKGKCFDVELFKKLVKIRETDRWYLLVIIYRSAPQQREQ